MRYEYLTLNISTAALDKLHRILDNAIEFRHPDALTPVGLELLNLMNECHARLQRRDLDPNANQGLL